MNSRLILLLKLINFTNQNRYGGIIQIVGHSETLYNISQKRKMSILNLLWNIILRLKLKI